MPIHHIGIHVPSLPEATTFFTTALSPLGYKHTHTPHPSTHGFSASCGPDFWVTSFNPGVSTTAHIAFAATSKKQVDAFWKAATAAGAEDNGKPGVRDYVPGYYAAYVKWEGVNVEVVYMAWERAAMGAVGVAVAAVAGAGGWWLGRRGYM